MFNKLFGKKPKFFLELKDNEPKQPNTEVPVAEVEPETAAAPPAEKPAPAEPKAKKTSVKKNKAKTEKVAQAKPEVVVPIAVSQGKSESKEVQFATKYLIVPTLSRRQPGPSLNVYKEMARQAKVPIR